MDQPTELLTELQRRVSLTKAARFAAHRRLVTQDNWSTWTVAILTSYLIAGSVFIPLLSHDRRAETVLNAGLVVASILVLVLSLIEASKKYALRAERLHICAVQLGALELELLDISTTLSGVALSAAASTGRIRYDSILSSCQENHEPIDHDKVKLQHDDKYHLGKGTRARLIASHFVTTRGPYLLVMVLPPSLVLLLL